MSRSQIHYTKPYSEVNRCYLTCLQEDRSVFICGNHMKKLSNIVRSTDKINLKRYSSKKRHNQKNRVWSSKTEKGEAQILCFMNNLQKKIPQLWVISAAVLLAASTGTAAYICLRQRNENSSFLCRGEILYFILAYGRKKCKTFRLIRHE